MVHKMGTETRRHQRETRRLRHDGEGRGSERSAPTPPTPSPLPRLPAGAPLSPSQVLQYLEDAKDFPADPRHPWHLIK